MSWNKGSVHEKDVRVADFQAATKDLTDALVRHPPEAGLAALAYMVACTLIVNPKKDFDKAVDFYVGKIKIEVLDEFMKLDPKEKASITDEINRKLKKARR